MKLHLEVLSLKNNGHTQFPKLLEKRNFRCKISCKNVYIQTMARDYGENFNSKSLLEFEVFQAATL